MTLEIKTAEELVDREVEARWAERRAGRSGEIFRHVLRTFTDRDGPVAVETIIAAFPDRPRGAVLDALATLDANDLIFVRDGRVELAYPFSAAASPFMVILPDGRQRYACCAIDALGIAAMLGERVTNRARCHHCQESLEFSADARGPGPDAQGIMVWVGKRRDGEGRIATSL
jgi:hypothetical protein